MVDALEVIVAWEMRPANDTLAVVVFKSRNR
jgi:hypothetical protein